MAPNRWKVPVILMTLALGLLPLAAQAHPSGWAPFFRIDGQFPTPYPIILTDPQFDQPQSLANLAPLPNQTLDFLVDQRLITIDPGLGPVTYAIDTGDGHRYNDTHIRHAFSRPGSYIVKVILTATERHINGTIEATLVNVVPYQGYHLPKPLIELEGKATDPNHIINFDPGQSLHFDAHSSQSGGGRLIQFQWDFDDGTASGDIATIHRFDPKVTQDAMVVLRVRDEQGILSDTFVITHNRYLGGASVSPNWGQRIGTKYLDVLTTLRRTIARLGGVGTPLPLTAVFLTLLVAMGLGALHALTPGHSKSLMTALLVGKTDSRHRDVWVLAGTITTTHTAVIYLLGLIFLILDNHHSLIGLLPIFQRVSAALVLALGTWMLFKGARALLHHRYHRLNETEAGHGHDFRAFTTAHSAKDLVLAGISGGLVPCLDALSLLVLAASVHAVAFGLLIVLTFSLGLAGSIIALGLIVLQTKHLLKFDGRRGQGLALALPVVTGLIIMMMGGSLLLAR